MKKTHIWGMYSRRKSKSSNKQKKSRRRNTNNPTEKWSKEMETCLKEKIYKCPRNFWNIFKEEEYTGTGRRTSLQRNLKRGQRVPRENQKPMKRHNFQRKKLSKILKRSKIQRKVKTEYILLNLTILWYFISLQII